MPPYLSMAGNRCRALAGWTGTPVGWTGTPVGCNGKVKIVDTTQTLPTCWGSTQRRTCHPVGPTGRQQSQRPRGVSNPWSNHFCLLDLLIIGSVYGVRQNILLELGWNAHANTKTTRPRKWVKKVNRFFLMVVVVVGVVVFVMVVVYGLEEWCNLSCKKFLFSEEVSKTH